MADLVVIGAGNVGSAFLAFLASSEETLSFLSRVSILSRSEAAARAAILDASSAFPYVAGKYVVGSRAMLEEADYVVVCAGHKQERGESLIDHLERNKSVLHHLFANQHLKSSAVLIIVPSPVDQLTPALQQVVGHPHHQVMGFGGDLDYNRLKCAMVMRQISNQPLAIIGEHGPRSIPVIEDEAEYHNLAEDVRNHLVSITRAVGQPRNLASGALLVKLLHSMVSDSQNIHFVCGYHPHYESYITWPFIIGHLGTVAAKDINIGPNATRDLAKLISTGDSN